MQTDWAYAEVYRAKLWDPRCRHTLASALQRLGENAQLSFSRALGSQRKAVSRILHHQKTSAHDLLTGHLQASSLRCQNQDFVLVASDTTSADFTSHKAVEGLGPISDKPRQQGFLIHSALAMTPSGIPLGLLHQQSWVRQAENAGCAKERRKRAFQDKESHKWLEALRAVEALLPKVANVLLIQDREADIFDFFAAPRREGCELLIRATQPRRVQIANQGTLRSLFEAVQEGPLVSRMILPLQARPGRVARQAHLSVRVQQVWIQAPKNGLSSGAEPVKAYVVRASEENPPPGVEEPLEWVLLTTREVLDGPSAELMVGYYAKRWLIERFHFVLKSGCGLERLQLDGFETLQKALSLYSIVAWRLLHLTYLAREAPQTRVEEALGWEERQVLERTSGQAISTVGEAVLAVARLGGFHPVPSAPTPGVKSLWIGLRKLNDMVAGYRLARQPPPPT